MAVCYSLYSIIFFICREQYNPRQSILILFNWHVILIVYYYFTHNTFYYFNNTYLYSRPSQLYSWCSQLILISCLFLCTYSQTSIYTFLVELIIITTWLHFHKTSYIIESGIWKISSIYLIIYPLFSYFNHLNTPSRNYENCVRGRLSACLTPFNWYFVWWHGQFHLSC